MLLEEKLRLVGQPQVYSSTGRADKQPYWFVVVYAYSPGKSGAHACPPGEKEATEINIWTVTLCRDTIEAVILPTTPF